jgi:hypothetical protein
VLGLLQSGSVTADVFWAVLLAWFCCCWLASTTTLRGVLTSAVRPGFVKFLCRGLLCHLV